MSAANEQYGNKGYGQIGYGANPYDQRDASPAGDRYNNYAQGRYDDRTFCPLNTRTRRRRLN